MQAAYCVARIIATDPAAQCQPASAAMIARRPSGLAAEFTGAPGVAIAAWQLSATQTSLFGAVLGGVTLGLSQAWVTMQSSSSASPPVFVAMTTADPDA